MGCRQHCIFWQLCPCQLLETWLLTLCLLSTTPNSGTLGSQLLIYRRQCSGKHPPHSGWFLTKRHGFRMFNPGVNAQAGMWELPAAAAAAAKSLQSYPTLCDPIDSSPPGFAVPGILQARTLEWVATAFSNAWEWKVTVKSLSRVRLFATPWTAAYQAPPSMGFSRQEYWSGLPLLFWVCINSSLTYYRCLWK